jgi:hypothetical protein
MIRFLIRFLLLAVIVGGGGMFAAQWHLKNDLKDFTNKVRPFMDFSYDSASISYNGEVNIQGINIYIQSAGAQVDVGQLKFFVGNLYQLATFKSNYEANHLPEKAHLVLKNVLLPFDSKMLKQLNRNKVTTSFDIMETAFCGPVQSFGLDEYEAMGYSYLSFSSETYYQLDTQSGSVIIKGSIDVEEVNKTEYQFNIGGVLSWYEEMIEKMSGGSLADNSFITPELSFLEVSSKDQGYNLRKAEYCSSQENAKTDYYSGHILKLEEILAGVGMSIPEEIKPLYLESIQPDSLVNFQVQPKVNFDLANMMRYEYAQLVESSGMQISVNDKPVNLLLADWSFSKLENILQIAKVKQEEEYKQKKQYEILMVQRKYQKVPVSSLDSYVHLKAKITRNDRKRFEGKIERTTTDKVWLIVHNQEGDVILPFNKNEITQVEIYKEVSMD